MLSLLTTFDKHLLFDLAISCLTQTFLHLLNRFLAGFFFTQNIVVVNLTTVVNLTILVFTKFKAIFVKTTFRNRVTILWNKLPSNIPVKAVTNALKPKSYSLVEGNRTTDCSSYWSSTCWCCCILSDVLKILWSWCFVFVLPFPVWVGIFLCQDRSRCFPFLFCFVFLRQKSLFSLFVLLVFLKVLPVILVLKLW